MAYHQWTNFPASAIPSEVLSIWRITSGLIFLLVPSLVKYCQYGISPVNHSDSDEYVDLVVLLDLLPLHEIGKHLRPRSEDETQIKGCKR